MPVVLEETSQFDASVTIPAPLEAASIASGSPLRGAFRTLTNRTRWLYDLLQAVRRLQYATSAEDLKSIDHPAGGDVALLLGPGGGLYTFAQVSSPPSDDTPGYIYVGTGGTTGVWLLAIPALWSASGPGGALRYDDTFVPRPNRLVTVKSEINKTSSPVSITGTHQVGPFISFDELQEGDIVLVDGGCQFELNGNTGANSLCISINGVAEDDSFISMVSSGPVSTFLVFVVPATTAWTFQLQAATFAAFSPAAKVRPNYRLRAMVFRP